MTTHNNTGSAPLVQHIYAGTEDVRVRESMLIGSLLEGGSWDGPWATGDHGTSGGPFQIHYTVHPEVVAAARARGVSPIALTNDPGYAVSFMLGAYKAAVEKVPAGLWNTNPELAAETAARLAERPQKDYYATHGSKAVHAAWATTSAQVHGGKDPGLPPPGGSGSDSAVTANAATTGSDTGSGDSNEPGVAHIKIPISIPGIPDISFDFPWLRISLFIGGAALVLMGTKMLFTGGGPGAEPGATPEVKHVPVPVPV